jgi:hypothetical protein
LAVTVPSINYFLTSLYLGIYLPIGNLLFFPHNFVTHFSLIPVQPVTKELAGTCELAYKLMKCLNVVTRKHGYYNDFLKSDK